MNSFRYSQLNPCKLLKKILMIIKHINIGWYGGMLYVTPATQYMTMLFCCIFFVPLFFLRCIWSRFPIGCYQGSIPVSKLYFAVVGGAVVFHLSSLGTYTLPFPLWLYEFADYLIFDWALLIAHQRAWFVYCPLSIVYYLFRQPIYKSWIIINTLTGGRLRLTADNLTLVLSVSIVIWHFSNDNLSGFYLLNYLGKFAFCAFVVPPDPLWILLSIVVLLR